MSFTDSVHFLSPTFVAHCQTAHVTHYTVLPAHSRSMTEPFLGYFSIYYTNGYHSRTEAPSPYLFHSSSSNLSTTLTSNQGHSDMMNSLYGVQSAGCLTAGYPLDPMFDGLPRQMDLSQSTRRLSRNSNGQRSGSAMRVTKPSSTNSSPRSSATMRRRTLMNDSNVQRRQQVLEHMSMHYSTQDEQPTKRRDRPVSWHPNSYGQPQLQPQQPCYLSTPSMYVDQQDMYAQYSPLMASYSCNTSPSATYSPLALPFHSVDGLQQYVSVESKTYDQASSLYPTSTPHQYAPGASSRSDGSMETTTTNGWDWNTFIMHGFNATTPPTPEAFPQTQLSQPMLSEESLPFEPLEEPEEEGEILVGMGLYDTPDKYEEDPQLNNYRTTVSSLLGSTFRSQEPRGKGLKLEETWEPPKSDDEEDDEDDDSSSD